MTVSAQAGDTGFTFGVSGMTFGNVEGSGEPTTVFNSTKNGWNETAFDLGGVGCLNCADMHAEGSVNVGEEAHLDASTDGSKSGTVFGSGGKMQLGAKGAVTGNGDTAGFQTLFAAGGDVSGMAAGDEVSTTSQQSMGGTAYGLLDYSGSPCGVGGSCAGNGGDLSLEAFTGGWSSGYSAATASGHGAIALSNSTKTMLGGMLTSITASE